MFIKTFDGELIMVLPWSWYAPGACTALLLMQGNEFPSLGAWRGARVSVGCPLGVRWVSVGCPLGVR